jgi:hypothetical protein
MLPHVLPEQLVLGAAMHGCGEISHAVPEPGVIQGQVFLGPCPTHIDPARFSVEYALKGTWQRGGPVPVEVALGAVPDDGSIGQDDQQVGRRLVLAPVLDLASYPH